MVGQKTLKYNKISHTSCTCRNITIFKNNGLFLL